MRELLLRIEKKFNTISEREQKIFPFFMMVCIVLVFYYLIITPLSDKTRRLNQEIEQTRTEVHALEQKVKVMDTLKVKIEEGRQMRESLIERFKVMNARIPDSDQVASILSFFASSEKVSFLIREFTGQEYIKEKRYTEIPVTVNLGGDFPSIMSFLHSLQSSERLMDIHDIALTVEENQLSASFTVSAYKIQHLEQILKGDTSREVSGE